MCGIFAYIGPQDPIRVCLEGLRYLEYRGYDSSGIGGLTAEGKLVSLKEVGKLQALEERLKLEPLELNSFAIAHTRWATHGQRTRENAHPHMDQRGTLALVHNGIIENHASLRAMLKSEGVAFQSDTDSEVLAQLIAHLYCGDLLATVQKALAMLQGFWAIALIHKNHPDQIIAAARELPISIALCSKRQEALISSDANAFAAQGHDVLFLNSDEIAVIKKDRIDVFNDKSSLVTKETQRIAIESQETSKGSFEHFMLKEIFEQPQTIQQAFHNRFLEDFGTAEFEDFKFTSKELLSIKRIVILGCGTSWHAGCIAASLLEDKARIPTTAEIASEFRYKNPTISEDTLVIAISQSGETLDTIAAVREIKSKGAKVLGLCNVRHSSLTREADSCLFLRAGPEMSVCSTKAFTSQLTVLALFSLLMARLRHLSKEEGQIFLQELQVLPQKIRQVLTQKDHIHALAKKYARYEDFFFLGRHYMFTTSLEAALKLKEITYLNAMGYPAG
ncbi:MAG: glutamine--fructose-6-phosphate transaminase (isomerizing), partial [Anaerolineae bacterium]